MLIILSSRYIEPELALHYGHIPPVFLPIGGERLLSKLIRDFSENEKFFITLPNDFNTTNIDKSIFENLDCELLKIDSKLSLNEALRHVLSRVSTKETVRILFGDTHVELSNDEKSENDYVVVENTQDNYVWTYAMLNEKNQTIFYEDPIMSREKNLVVSGYFCFSDIELLREAFKETKFNEALNFYSKQKNLKLKITNKWLDFGHLTSYYKSKKEMLVTRAFNNLDVNNSIVTKTSIQSIKVQAEATWFENIPISLATNTPRYLGRINKNYKNGYMTEYLYHPLLSDMFVFGKLNHITYALMINNCLDLLSSFRAMKPPQYSPEDSPDYATQFYNDIFVDKTIARLKFFCDEHSYNFNDEFTINGTKLEPLSKILQSILSNIDKTKKEDICFWHGDFFLGNLFFDFNSQRILMVDPRGMLTNKTFTQYGDFRYDLGKLAHSILGGYDNILANRYIVGNPSRLVFDLSIPDFENETQKYTEKLFIEQVKYKFNVTKETLISLTILVFFSLLPLHKEDQRRQLTLFANGLRLYAILKGKL